MNTLADHLINKQRVILFDFDGTVFDTAKLKTVISEQLKKHTADTQLLWDTERELRDERFHLIKTMKVFSEKAGITHVQNTIQNIFLQQNFPAFIFTDVIQNIQHLHSDNILALFSEGDETYQQVKIFQSHLNSLFDFIYIYHKKLQYLEEVLSFFENKEIWYVDNQLNKLQKAHEQFPDLKTVWINREHLTPNVEFSPHASITSLDELSALLS